MLLGEFMTVGDPCHRLHRQAPTLAHQPARSKSPVAALAEDADSYPVKPLFQTCFSISSCALRAGFAVA